MRNELDGLVKLAKDTDATVFAGFLISPTGVITSYTRLIMHIDNISEESFRFYTDDLHDAMYKVLEERKA